MERELRGRIERCILDKGDMEELKKACLVEKQLRRGLVTEAEVNADLPTTEIEKFLKRYNHKNDTKSIDHWIKFVEENFETLETTSRRDIKGKGRATDDQGANDPNVKVQGKPKSPNEEIRCCTAQMKKIINDRILKDISKHIQDTLDSTLVEASDYITDYSVRLLSLILLLKENTFKIEDKSISLKPTKGFAIADILPGNYRTETTVANVPPPLKRSCLESDTFNKHYKNMFSADHLQVIQAIYFGPIGSRTRDPIYTSFTNIIPRETSTLPKLDAYVMKIALATYATNFQNMWKNSNKIRKLSNNLITVLLKIHLAPTREARYKEYIEKKEV
ncbi:hypothetical protein [Parasitella parasitica]|uniref:Uncharacterized protein n=1 Tax=Parasitella parasitica TaxID=35722 RepID=A0A0B7MZJ6_9FUNG|nr:hypothetical protein [Parasitella parasitica]